MLPRGPLLATQGSGPTPDPAPKQSEEGTWGNLGSSRGGAEEEGRQAPGPQPWPQPRPRWPFTVRGRSGDRPWLGYL